MPRRPAWMKRSCAAVSPPMRSVIFERSLFVKVNPAIFSAQCSVVPSSPRRFRSSSSKRLSSASTSITGRARLSLSPTTVVPLLIASPSSHSHDFAGRRLLAEADETGGFNLDFAALGRRGNVTGDLQSQLAELRLDHGIGLAAVGE